VVHWILFFEKDVHWPKKVDKHWSDTSVKQVKSEKNSYLVLKSFINAWTSCGLFIYHGHAKVCMK